MEKQNGIINMTGRFGEGDFFNWDKITRQDKELFI